MRTSPVMNAVRAAVLALAASAAAGGSARATPLPPDGPDPAPYEATLDRLLARIGIDDASVRETLDAADAALAGELDAALRGRWLVVRGCALAAAGNHRGACRVLDEAAQTLRAAGAVRGAAREALRRATEDAEAIAFCNGLAPDIVAESWLDGREVRVSENRGRVLVVHLIQPSCPASNRAYLETLEWKRVFERPDFEMVAVVVQSDHVAAQSGSSPRDYVRAREAPYPVALDRQDAPDGATATYRLFRARSTPTTYVIDRYGRFRHAGHTKSGRFEIPGLVKRLLEEPPFERLAADLDREGTPRRLALERLRTIRTPDALDVLVGSLRADADPERVREVLAAVADMVEGREPPGALGGRDDVARAVRETRAWRDEVRGRLAYDFRADRLRVAAR